jgi:hypothetical protein
VQGSTVVQGDTVDCQDATAGMFLVAADNAWSATHDATQLQAAMNGITGAVQAIAAVQDSDGLTWALPGYHVKYLMDEAETYGGLVGAAALAAAAGDAPLLRQASSMATEMANGVNSLWDPATGAYDWARHGDGVQQQIDWDVAYPDALEEAWAVAYNLVPAARATTLMETVVQHVPAWGQPGTTATFRTNGSLGTQQLGYWPVVGWALADVGESGQANSGTDAISEFAARSTDAWPFTPAIAGELVVAASGGAAVPSA